MGVLFPLRFFQVRGVGEGQVKWASKVGVLFLLFLSRRRSSKVGVLFFGVFFDESGCPFSLFVSFFFVSGVLFLCFSLMWTQKQCGCLVLHAGVSYFTHLVLHALHAPLPSKPACCCIGVLICRSV